MGLAFAQQPQTQAIGANASPTTGKASMTTETTGPVVEQLKQLEDDWSKAELTKNANELQRIEATDYEFVMPDGKVRTQPEDIASLQTSSYTDFSNGEMSVRVFGDTAVVTGVAQIKGTEAGKDVSGNYRYTDVFVKRNGRWEAVHTQATKLTP